MKSLRDEQSAVKSQGQDPTCVVFAAVAAIEWALIRAGKPKIIDEMELFEASNKLVLYAQPGDKYGPGTVDKMFTVARERGLVDGYQHVHPDSIEKYIDQGYPVVIILKDVTIDNVKMTHGVLITGYTDTHFEYKNSWGPDRGDGGYYYLPKTERKVLNEPGLIVFPKKGAPMVTLERPVPHVITQGYGENVAFYNTKALGFTQGHPGVDFGCPVGTPVKCAADGVLMANRTIAGALVMTVKHDFGTTEYWHLSKTVGNVGDKVKRGQIICYSGNTGRFSTAAHLHWEYHPNTGGNPKINGTVDPMPLVKESVENVNIADYEGKVISCAGKTYLVKDGKRIWSPDSTTFFAHNLRTKGTQEVSQGVVNAIPDGGQLQFKDAPLKELFEDMKRAGYIQY